MAFRYRLGVDIGGTFTDATLINEETGEIRVGKVPSTPQDPSHGFMEATHRILREAGVSPDEVSYVVHGTTVATNSIIEGKVARTGFVTTDGFRDLLEIQRQIRPSLYDLQFEKPRPLTPRYLCFGVPERLDAQGKVLTPLNESAVRNAAAQLRQENVESIAICFLHAYINPSHEKRTGRSYGKPFPTLSSPFRQRSRQSFESIFGQVQRSSTLPSGPSSGVTSRALKHGCARKG